RRRRRLGSGEGGRRVTSQTTRIVNGLFRGTFHGEVLLDALGTVALEDLVSPRVPIVARPEIGLVLAQRGRRLRRDGAVTAAAGTRGHANVRAEAVRPLGRGRLEACRPLCRGQKEQKERCRQSG